MSSRKLLVDLAQKYPLRLALNFSLGFSGALFNGIGTTLIVPILLSFLGQDMILESGPPIIRYSLAPFQQLPERYQLLAMAAAILLIIILKNLTTYANNLATASFNRAITADLQEQGLQLLLDVDLDYFTKAKAGDLMNRLGGEIVKATGIISQYITLISTCITILVFLGILLSLSWQLTILATALLPISTLGTQRLIKRSKQLGKVITSISQEYAGNLIELFSGIRLVKSMGNENREYERLQALIRDREKAEMNSKVVTSLIAPLGEVTNVATLCILVFASRLLFASDIEALAGILLTYLVVLNRMLPLVSQLNSTRSNLARSVASLDIVNDLMRRDNKSFMGNGSRPFDSFHESIQFNNVCFSYPGSTEAVLHNVSLQIAKGQTLALVGSSGAGKSTLVDLLPRFYDPTSGQITIDGRDIRDFDFYSLRRAMGIVSQDTFLFNTTIRENIIYGCSRVTEAELMDALKRANAYEFIARLPEGLDTQIGARGVTLSGGQRQRLAIARALLRDPEILILDEATSALDTVSEHLVQEAIDELSQERTTVVIAHRLSTVKRAHQIAVMERGQVVEVGTHDELLRKGGQYSKLYNMQFSNTAQQTAEDMEGRQRLLSRASYEFRANLNAMLGYLSLLTDGLVDTPEEQNEIAGEAYEAGIELFQTVRKLEELSKAADGSTPNPPLVEPHPVGVEE